MFGQLSNRESLRDLIVAFEAHRAKQYHLGLGREPIAKTTLASANQNRDYRIFEDFAFYMMKEACEKRTTNILDIPGKKYAFDSTTIPLCLVTFPWAKFRRMPKNVLTDAEVKLTGFLSEKKYPESFRLIRYYDEEDDREFTFLTNAKHLSALDVANLYKKRWLVELFFKWLKQHLKIKRFWGTTENAVRIQISVAIITYCLVAIVQHDMRLERSTYEVLQILSISLTDKTHLRDLFDKTNFNDVKDQFGPLIPGLFD